MTRVVRLLSRNLIQKNKLLNPVRNWIMPYNLNGLLAEEAKLEAQKAFEKEKAALEQLADVINISKDFIR